MKKYMRLIGAVLAVTIMLAIPVNAQEEPVPRSSAYFTAIATYLHRVSGTTFEVWFDVVATRTMDKIGVSKIVVQRSADGENWTNMRTYWPDVYTHMIKTNSGSHEGYVSYTGTSGYYYRAHVTFYAKNSSGTGEMYRYTEVIRV